MNEVLVVVGLVAIVLAAVIGYAIGYSRGFDAAADVARRIVANNGLRRTNTWTPPHSDVHDHMDKAMP